VLDQLETPPGDAGDVVVDELEHLGPADVERLLAHVAGPGPQERFVDVERAGDRPHPDARARTDVADALGQAGHVVEQSGGAGGPWAAGCAAAG